MSFLSSTVLTKNRLSQAIPVVLPFDQALRQRKKSRHCIFCGQTIRIQTFKGKAVCLNCLQIIPSLFSCG